MKTFIYLLFFVFLCPLKSAVPFSWVLFIWVFEISLRDVKIWAQMRNPAKGNHEEEDFEDDDFGSRKEGPSSNTNNSNTKGISFVFCFVGLCRSDRNRSSFSWISKVFPIGFSLFSFFVCEVLSFYQMLCDFFWDDSCSCICFSRILMILELGFTSILSNGQFSRVVSLLRIGILFWLIVCAVSLIVWFTFVVNSLKFDF